MENRDTRTRPPVVLSVLLVLSLLLSSSLAPAVSVSSGGQADAIAQWATDGLATNPPSADRTSAVVPDSRAVSHSSADRDSMAAPGSSNTTPPDTEDAVSTVKQDTPEATTLEEAAALVYDHTHPMQPMPVEKKLVQDIAEIAQLLNMLSDDNLDAEEKALLWDLLESKREEIRVDDLVLTRKFEEKRAELRRTDTASAVAHHDTMTKQVQEKIDGLAQVMDGLLGAKLKGQARLSTLESAREYVTGLLPRPPEQSYRPQPPPLRMPDIDPNEFEKIPMPERALSAIRESSTFSSPPPPTADDLAPTLEVQITQEIIDLAASLNNSPLEIYEYVRDNFEYAPYYGSMMGSTAVLWSGNGNDYDLASLLIALLRAAGTPARYAKANVWIPEAQAQNWLGVQATDAVTRTLAWAGPRTYANGYVGREHVWVEAYVPYGNYRGLANDDSDYVWVPMDPSFKLKTYQDGIDVSSCGEFDYDGYFSRIQRFLPYEMYQDQIRECLNASFPGKTLADVGYVGTIDDSNFDFLPSSLPYLTYDEPTRFAEVDDGLRHKVAITLTEGSTVLLETTLTLPEVSLDRLTLSYDDVGGNTLRPQLKRNGQVLVTGANTTLGHGNVLALTLIPHMQWLPEDWRVAEGHVTAGEYHTLFFYTLQASQRLLDERAQRLLDAIELIGTADEDPDDLIGELLNVALIKFQMRRDEAIQAVDEIQKLTSTRFGRIGVTKASLDIQYLSDIPFAVFPDKLVIDHVFWHVLQVRIDGEPYDPSWVQQWFKVVGTTGSALEHQLWEDLVKLDSISTVKGLQYLNENGFPLLTFTSDNIDGIHNTQLEEYIKQKVIEDVNKGWEVTVPDDEFTYNDWNGAVWRSRDPETYNAGWYISGGFRGGATTTDVPYEELDIQYYGGGTGIEPLRTAFDGDPVNIANGNLIHTETDFAIRSRGLPLNWTRTYNNKLDYDGPMGYGWTHSYNRHLVEDGDGNVTVMDTDGAQHLFTREPDGSYTSPSGVHSTLTKAVSDFTLREKHGTEYRFDLNGRLLSITDPNGNQVSLTYDGNGRLTTITDPVGRNLTLAYNADGRLTSITDFTGRQWTYGYDGDGNLTSATDPLNNTTTYTYYSGQFNVHNIHRIIDARGNAITFVYYTNDKVFRHTNALGETRTFSYNPFWQETTVVNEEGYTRHYVYDEDGQLIKLTEETGGVRTYAWDDDRNLLSHTDPFGHTTTYEYDDRGNRTREVDPLGQTVVYEYEPVYNKPTRKDDNGHVTQMAYDSHGNLTSVTDALGNTTTTTYNAYGQPITITGPLNNVTTNTYDAFGNLIQVEDALANVTQYQHDALGRLTQTTDANGHITTRSYDPLDRLISVTDALGNTTLYTYDAVGNRTSITNALGHTTTHLYDAANRRVETTDALGDVTTFEYDGLGNLVARTDPLGNRTSYAYDGLNNQIRVTDPLGNLSRAAYDANSNLIQTIDANGHVTTNEYDALNRLVRVTDPLSNVTQYQYDAWGNMTVATDANGNVTQNFYDDLNRLIRTRDALGQEVAYQYDALGNLTQLTDANGNSITQQFDLLSRLTAVSDALGNTTTYEYDSVGNQTRITDARGLVTDLNYDEVNRLIERSYEDSTSDTFQYNAVGNMLQAASPAATLSYEYDSLNRLTRITDSRFNKSIQYSYDAAGNLLSMTNPEGGVTAYRYDQANRLVSQTEPDGLTIFYTYDPAGNRTERNLSLGHRTAYSYDAANRLTSLINIGPEGNTLSQNIYTYDAVGNVLSMTDLQGTHTYTYNDVYWLTGVTYPWGDFETFTYDVAGNRLSLTDSSGTVNYTYDDANRMLTAGPVSFDYDANGNLTERTDADGTTAYTFDQRNQLVGVQFPAGSGLPDTVIAYDALGNRVRKVDSSGETRYFLNSRREVVSEYDGSNAWQATYKHGPGLDELIGRTTASQTYYYLTDALRSVAAIADSAGQELARYDYRAFGEIANQSGSLADHQSFTGRERDPDSGYLYMRARYYDPVSGRFASKDPIGYEGGINLYAYVANNPLRFVDPFGTNPEDWVEMAQDLAISRDLAEVDALATGADLDWLAGLNVAQEIGTGVTSTPSR